MNEVLKKLKIKERLKMSHKKNGMSTIQVHWSTGFASALFGLAVLLAFSGCAGNQTKYELPFGSQMDVDALEASIVLTGEGNSW